jgi:hypothetical protein
VLVPPLDDELDDVELLPAEPPSPELELLLEEPPPPELLLLDVVLPPPSVTAPPQPTMASAVPKAPSPNDNQKPFI